MRVVHIDHDEFGDVVDQLQRYGNPEADILRVLDALSELNDDRHHGRDEAQARAKIDAAVRGLEWWAPTS